MELSEEQKKRLIQLENDAGDGNWGTNNPSVKKKQSDALGILPAGATPIDVADLNGFEEETINR